MYFLVNVARLKPLDVATSNCVGAPKIACMNTKIELFDKKKPTW